MVSLPIKLSRPRSDQYLHCITKVGIPQSLCVYLFVCVWLCVCVPDCVAVSVFKSTVEICINRSVKLGT